MNTGASIAARLAAIARKQGRDHSFILSRYGIERLLWRLSQAQCRDDFIVKGATLFLLWNPDSGRPTRDLDLLGRGDPSLERIGSLFLQLCSADTSSQDGLVFHPGSVATSRIKEAEEYEGVRVRMLATLERTRIDIQVDVGFGDAVVPAPIRSIFPTLLGMPAPEIQAYPPEVVVAEKLHAIVHLAERNTRMKDFYDLRVLLESARLDNQALTKAIGSTFQRRGTPVPQEIPAGMRTEFARDASRMRQWSAFHKRSGIEQLHTLEETVGAIRLHLGALFGSAGSIPEESRRESP